MIDFKKAKELIEKSERISIVQAENPDGDSLGSSIALENVLQDLEKKVSMYCPVEIPKYMRYISGWDRVETELDTKSDLIIIVDTMSDVLLSKVLDNPAYRNLLSQREVLVIDHHISVDPDLSFEANILLRDSVSATQVIYDLCEFSGWNINLEAANSMLAGLLSDTLGLSTQNVNSDSYMTAAKLTKLGAKTFEIEEARREFMKKSPEILEYKGRLIERIEYYLDGKLALINIPFEEIEAYSDQYNPSVLVLDEMRFVIGVEIAVAIKTYPDGKLTGKIRSNSPISSDLAKYFGGGGHKFAAGFRVYENKDKIIEELIYATDKIIKEKS